MENKEKEIKSTKHAGLVVSGLIFAVLVVLIIGVFFLWKVSGSEEEPSTIGEVVEITEVDPTEVDSSEKTTTESKRNTTFPSFFDMQPITEEPVFGDKITEVGIVTGKQMYESSSGQVVLILDILLQSSSSETGLTVKQPVTLTSYNAVEVGSKLEVSLRVSDGKLLVIDGLSGG